MVRRFVKYHGLGNDFVVMDTEVLMSRDEAVAICDRHRGVGADGVLSLLPSRRAEAQLRMHIFNADGSVAEMCGNGLRCVVRHALGPSSVGQRVVVDTDAGLRWGVTGSGGDVQVGLGRPEIVRDRLEVVVEGERFVGTWVSMGNPHFVLDPMGAEDLGTVDVEGLEARARRWGPLIEHHPAFPDRTNVEWVRATADLLEVVVWERGSGLTQACGTGAGATLAAMRARGVVRGDEARVRLPGGVLRVSRDPATEEIAIAGEAVRVFEGEV